MTAIVLQLHARSFSIETAVNQIGTHYEGLVDWIAVDSEQITGEQPTIFISNPIVVDRPLAYIITDEFYR